MDLYARDLYMCIYYMLLFLFCYLFSPSRCSLVDANLEAGAHDGPVDDDDAEYPAVDEEEGQGGEPEAREEGAGAEELELVALAEPGGLVEGPEEEGGEAEPGGAQHGGGGEVEGEEDHVPEEVLREKVSAGDVHCGTGGEGYF